ncbi:MAG: hypothetical protein GF411_09180 [Candidatus Lokiarchaeota archaeon]|nr:hypothetical protein [Candidatus Lokiarchaeota archaeon]
MSNDWKTHPWLDSAKRILNNISESAPSMIVVRHSHREDSTDVDELLKKRLTPIGHEMAFEFGRRLPKKKHLQLFYSKHPRCVETAEGILRGHKKDDGNGEMVQDIRVLLGPFGSGEKIGDSMITLGGIKFVNDWILNKFSTDVIEKHEDFKRRFIKETIGRLMDSSEDVIQCHVTHDLVLMGAKCALFNMDASDENWTPYLGGIVACRKESGGVSIYEAETHKRISINSRIYQ